MATIYVQFRDGTSARYEDNGRPGGSWSQSIRYEEGFAVITDAYGKQISLPTDLVKSIEVESTRRW